jgi:hypothetical protein
MAEWIGEPTLAMDPPWHMVILEVFETPVAPASNARATIASGSSQNSSTLTVVVAISFGLFQAFLAGWAKKKGALAISKPATGPRLHSSIAPRARLYHSTAAGASGTASMREMTGVRGWEVMKVVSSLSVLLTANGTRPHFAAYHRQ